MNQDELLDLVDSDDKVIGTIWRSATYNLKVDGGKYIRAANLFVQNGKGELWIPKRTLQKKLSPGGLDYAAAGHVESGETYLESLIREAKEEINVDIDRKDMKLLGKMLPRVTPYFLEFYLYRTNETPDYNPDDYTEAFWIQPADLEKMLKEGTPAKPDLLVALQMYFA